MPPKTSKPPVSAFSEPSEPSALKPEDKPKAQLTGPQEENPQAVVTASRKAADAKVRAGVGAQTQESRRSDKGGSTGSNSRRSAPKGSTSSLPPSAFSEPSEPGDIAPKDKSREQVSREQEENPQAVVTASEDAAGEKRKTEKSTQKAKL
jgi:hypothetical protein